MLKMFPCESIFPQDEYVPRREKVHKTGIYSQMRIYSPNWEIFPQWGKFPPGRNIFLFGENEGNIFPFGEKEGNIFPFGIPRGNIFPPFTPDPPRLGENYLRHFLYLQTKVLEVSIYEVPRKYSPGNLGKIFPQKF